MYEWFSGGSYYREMHTLDQVYIVQTRDFQEDHCGQGALPMVAMLGQGIIYGIHTWSGGDYEAPLVAKQAPFKIPLIVLLFLLVRQKVMMPDV